MGVAISRIEAKPECCCTGEELARKSLATLVPLHWEGNVQPLGPNSRTLTAACPECKVFMLHKAPT